MIEILIGALVILICIIFFNLANKYPDIASKVAGTILCIPLIIITLMVCSVVGHTIRFIYNNF